MTSSAQSWSLAELLRFSISSATSVPTLLGAERFSGVTGLDFSVAAITEARSLAEACGVAAQWVSADVHRAPAKLRRTFDIVYTGKGALTWLDDISHWAEVANELPNPGGRLYLVEFHPISWVPPADGWRIAHDYFSNGDPCIEESIGGSYAALNLATRANLTAEWQHSLGDIISAIAGQGLRIDWLHEYPHSHFAQTTILERDPAGWYTHRVPEGVARIPLLYSQIAHKDA